MTNVFKDSFVCVAQRWTPGVRYSGGLVNFHDCLMYLAYTYSSTRFLNIPNSLFSDFRGMDPYTVKTAREQAAKLSWIGYEPTLHGFNYWLLDADGKPLVPAGKVRARKEWMFDRERWQKHLAKASEKFRTKKHGEPPERFRSSIGKIPRHHRKDSEPDFGELTDTTQVADGTLPLKETLNREDSEGVGFGFGSDSEIPWSEVGSGREKSGRPAAQMERARTLEHVAERPRLCTLHGFHSEWWPRADEKRMSHESWWVCGKCHPELCDQAQQVAES